MLFSQAEPRGTYWYHSHVGAQRTNGAYGSFIVKERPVDGVVQPKDFLMTVGDWHHHDSNEVSIILQGRREPLQVLGKCLPRAHQFDKKWVIHFQITLS